MPITPSNELRASLERHNQVFENLLQLIPAQFYLAQDRTDDNVCSSFLSFVPFYNSPLDRLAQNTRKTRRAMLPLSKLSKRQPRRLEGTR